MNITILNAKYVTNKHDVIDFILELDGIRVPYTYVVSNSNTSEVASFIKSKLSKNEVNIDPYDGPSDNEILIGSIRAKRNHLLEKYDMIMAIPDYPITESQRNEIKAYRQALRDITNQQGFPENIAWPAEPTCIKLI